jgi:hypothetical protein
MREAVRPLPQYAIMAWYLVQQWDYCTFYCYERFLVSATAICIKTSSLVITDNHFNILYVGSLAESKVSQIVTMRRLDAFVCQSGFNVVMCCRTACWL